MLALGRLKAGKMNKTEADYASMLETLKRTGDIAWYCFEGVKLRLAAATFYTPDFVVMMANGQLEMHEVKGFWTDDARVKIKVASEKFPFAFFAIRKTRGAWEVESL